VADGAPVLIWMSGPDKGGTWFNRAWLDFIGREMGQELGEGWLAGTYPDDLPALRVCAEAFDARQPFTTEFRLRRRDGAWRWMLDTGVPRFGPEGFSGFIGSCVDISERKAAEERQQLLLAELSHRVKNTLTLVQGIANRSLAGDRTLEEAREVFTKRLRALAGAHTLLTASEWRGASLQALAAAELGPYRGRAEAVGEDVTLGPKAAQSLALILHELATNAAKHGALSAPEGWVEVAWGLDGATWRLTWRETGGPEVRPAARRGFGRLLVEEAAAHDLGGQARLEFRREGLVYELEAPLDHLARG
jgi:PAS domain S-box-containing protein